MSDVRVYFEKQGADRLCGVHCLNSLLQGPVFTQADLNMYASELDKEESALLAADPSQPKPPRQMTISSLSNQPQSNHQDWSGYFSLGVLEKALARKCGVTVQNAARRDIIQQINREGLAAHEGFVIHLRDHWFSARAVGAGRQWFFLDSLKAAPTEVTENELWGTLQGIIQSGGNVFVLTGNRLPSVSTKPGVLKANQCWLSRDDITKRLQQAESGQEEGTNFTVVDPKRKIATDWTTLGSGNTLASQNRAADVVTDPDVQRAIAESANQLPEPKLEPESGPDVVTLLVRFPSGQRMVRKFSLSSMSVGDVFQWLEYVAAKAGILLPSQYALVGRGVRLDTQLPSSTPLTQTDLKPGQEALNLHI